MKPYQHIQETKKLIADMRNSLKYSKNKQADAEKINVLIDCVNSFDSMLVSKYRTDAVESLIYALIYEWLLMFGVSRGKPIPLFRMTKEIDDAICYGAELKKREVIHLLEDHELVNKLKINDGDVLNNTNFAELLERLVNEFKQQIVWKELI